MVPLIPILGVISAFYLMVNLPLLTWEVVGIWLVIGLVIYFTYSTKHSKVQALQTEVTLPR
jgi:APA family basic amino acid/polyamine antiporter